MASPDKKAFALRLDPALHDAIARLAGAELRSVNGQIEYVLRTALRAAGRLRPPAVEAVIEDPADPVREETPR